MIESIQKGLAALHGMNIYIEVIIIGILAYYTHRYWFEAGPKKSQWTPIIASYVAMLLFIVPVTAELAIKYVVLSGIHGVINIGVYSWGEKRGWLDMAGDFIEGKLGITRPANKRPPDPPAGTTPEVRP